MLTATLALALLVQSPEILGEREIMGRAVPISYAPRNKAVRESAPVALGEDFLVRTGPGTYRSLRSTDPVWWLKLAGIKSPKPDATPYRILVRVFTASERGADLFFFDDQETVNLLQGLATAEATLETALQGNVDVRFDVALDPTPIRNHDPLAVTQTMLRQDKWETDGGRMLDPHHAGLAVLPGFKPVAAVPPGETPLLPVYTTGGSVTDFAAQTVDALRHAIWSRGIALGFPQNDGIRGYASAEWISRLGQSARNGAEWVARRGNAVLPTSVNPPNEFSGPSVRFLAEGAFEAAPSLLLLVNGRGEAALWPEGPPPLQEIRVRNQIETDGTLKLERTGEILKLTHLGGTPTGSLSLGTVSPSALNTEVFVEVQGTLSFPIAFQVGEKQYEIPIRPRFSLVPMDATAWQRVRVVLPRGTQDLIITPFVPQEGFEGPSPGNQSIQIRSLTAGATMDPPAANAWESEALPPADSLTVASYAASTNVRYQLAAIEYDINNPSPAGLERLSAFTRSVHFSVSRRALEAIQASQPEEKWVEIFRYALEVGPFEHNRQAAAELIRQDQPKLTRALTTLVLARDWSTRLAVIPALAAQKGPDANVTLLLLLTDPESSTRQAAAANLKIDGELALRRLLYAAVNDPSESVRKIAYRRLLESTNPTYIAEGVKGIRDESFAVRSATLVAIRELGKADLQPTVKLALADSRLQVRVEAVLTLTALPGEVTRDDIATLLDDPYPPLQAALDQLLRAKNIAR